MQQNHFRRWMGLATMKPLVHPKFDLLQPSLAFMAQEDLVAVEDLTALEGPAT